MSRNFALRMSAALVAFALACSSSDSDSGGGTNQALGDQMSELSDLGDRFVGQNQATYDTLDQASQLIGAALEAGVPLASTGPKQAGCLPQGIAGTTVIVDVQSNTFTPTNPQGPQDAVQFRLLSDPQTEVGYVNVSCTGVLPSATSIDISVNTTNGVEVLSLVATNLYAFPPASFNATVAGALRSSDGQEEVPFGMYGFEGGSFLALDQFTRSSGTAFLVGQTVNATVIQNAYTDPSFPSEEITLVVQDAADFNLEFNCPSLFSYRATMQGTPGNVNGGGLFCARPPLGDDFNYFVNCDNGSIDNLVVSEADASCQANAQFEGDPTSVPGSVLQDIQEGSDALLGMHATVISVAEAGAEVALQLVANAQQPQP